MCKISMMGIIWIYKCRVNDYRYIIATYYNQYINLELICIVMP